MKKRLGAVILNSLAVLAFAGAGFKTKSAIDVEGNNWGRACGTEFAKITNLTTIKDAAVVSDCNFSRLQLTIFFNGNFVKCYEFPNAFPREMVTPGAAYDTVNISSAEVTAHRKLAKERGNLSDFEKVIQILSEPEVWRRVHHERERTFDPGHMYF